MTDFRALCAELVDALQYHREQTRPIKRTTEILTRARAALAQPEPQGPTDEELYDYWISTSPEFGCADPVGFARAVLARWGRTATAAKPVSVAERLPGPEDCDETGLTCNGGGWCWWFEQSSQMWVADFYSSHYTHWLPHHALPVPQP